MKIHYSPRFLKRFRKLPKDIQIFAERKVAIFQKSPFDSRLGTHKLQGKLDQFWAFWINRKVRIIFSFSEDGVNLHTIGGHDIYR